jgi:hypothetical protein
MSRRKISLIPEGFESTGHHVFHEFQPVITVVKVIVLQKEQQQQVNNDNNDEESKEDDLYQLLYMRIRMVYEPIGAWCRFCFLIYFSKRSLVIK